MPETPLFSVVADAGCSAVSKTINYDMKIYYVHMRDRYMKYTYLKKSYPDMVGNLYHDHKQSICKKRGSSGMAS